MLARQSLEEMPAGKDIVRPRRKFWIAKPVELNLTQAFGADIDDAPRYCRVFGVGGSAVSINSFIELIERLCRQDCAI